METFCSSVHCRHIPALQQAFKQKEIVKLDHFPRDRGENKKCFPSSISPGQLGERSEPTSHTTYPWSIGHYSSLFLSRWETYLKILIDSFPKTLSCRIFHGFEWTPGHLRPPKGVTCAQNQLCRLEQTTI